jgi:hypothetical protein
VRPAQRLRVPASPTAQVQVTMPAPSCSPAPVSRPVLVPSRPALVLQPMVQRVTVQSPRVQAAPKHPSPAAR